MNPLIPAGAGALLTLVTWVDYFRKVPSGKVPVRPVGAIAAQLSALGLAAAALGWPLIAGAPASAAVWGLAGFGALMASLFLWLLTQRKTPLGKLQVAVGDTLLPFTALTDTGATFHSDSLLGQRTLLKFFRGSW